MSEEEVKYYNMTEARKIVASRDGVEHTTITNQQVKDSELFNIVNPPNPEQKCSCWTLELKNQSM